MVLSTISAFIGISLAVIIMPGPDTALTIRNSIAYGNRAGLATVTGIVVGQLCWATAASLSLQALFISRAAAVVRRARVQRMIQSITGLALMGLGLKIAVGRN